MCLINYPECVGLYLPADNAIFRDEPLRFLISEESREAVEQMKKRVADAVESGVLAEIIERMRLE